jgi:arsenate reductase
MKVTIYHNPRCSKSRQTLALLEKRGLKPTVIEYLDTPPDYTTLVALLARLRISARDLLRSNEADFRELGLDAQQLDDEALLKAMAQHPRLIQRPIVVVGDHARIGRPPEAVLEILP